MNVWADLRGYIFSMLGSHWKIWGQALHYPACILNAIVWLLCGKQVEEGGRG